MPADRRGDGPLARHREETDRARRPLDRLAGQAALGSDGSPPRARAAAVGAVLGGRYGFRGGPGDYQRLEPSLPHRVPRRRGGLPILLSALWPEVARRAGSTVRGVALPGHFVVGFGPPDDLVLAGPFAGGRS